ncbi:MAG: 3-hydroxyacyl-ACP dehydratase FabZ family protein [Pirellulaceae bacterium]|nr:beta-hydroxyacyl-ACP dehydratase [Planctomycetales bacterium]
MRWLWIDRFVDFIRGERASAIKNVSVAEEQLQEYFPGYSMMPNSLIVEGVGQVGGLLLSELYEFEARVVLAKISRTRFYFPARPGDSLFYQAELDGITRNGARMVGTSHLGDRLQGEVEMFLAILDHRTNAHPPALFEPAYLLRMMRGLDLYRVGRTPDGQPLNIPDRMLAAERALHNSLENNSSLPSAPSID